MSDELLRPFLERPERSGIFLDFDGTLSDIVRVPSQARPVEGAAALLTQLGRRYAVVAIVSGRAAHELVEWLGPEVEIWGAHGAQRAVDGRIELSPLVAPFEELMREVHAAAVKEVEAAALEGVVVEDKGIMTGLHFRNASDVEVAERVLDEIAGGLAARFGLRRAGGRLAYELRPPPELSKAAVVSERGAGLSAVAFAGDDRVDLPGFDALDDLGAAGAATLRIAVRSDEAPPELLERADVVVDGPAGAVELLGRLVS